jgi:hypothetical protein
MNVTDRRRIGETLPANPRKVGSCPEPPPMTRPTTAADFLRNDRSRAALVPFQMADLQRLLTFIDGIFPT